MLKNTAWALLLLFGLWSQSYATIFTVNRVNDVQDSTLGDGICYAALVAGCTLRAAIQEANDNPGLDTINIPGGNYNLALTDFADDSALNGDLDITDSVNISGAGAGTVISAITLAPRERVFHILNGATVNISGVNIQYGIDNTATGGGGIYVAGFSNVKVTGSRILNNSAGGGGGIYVASGSALTLETSTVANNTTTGAGGGISSLGVLSIVNSTISTNDATSGGGIYYNGGTLTLNNVTIANNTTSSFGGGIYGNTNSPIVNNSIIVNNGSGGDCNNLAAFTTSDFNMDSDSSCLFSGANNLSGTAQPDIGTLQAVGGALVHPLNYNSPAIDAGNATSTGTLCASTDQRGTSRPVDGDGDGIARCDIGAYEFVNTVPVAANDAASTDEDTAVDIDVLANDSDPDGGPTLIDSITTQPANGTAAIAANVITYTPAQNYNGPDSFEYSVIDSNGGSAVAQVSITVNAVNDPPVAANDTATVNEGASVTIGVLDNDTDVDDGLDAASVTIVQDVTNGTTSVNTTTGAVTYTHNGTNTTTDSFTYYVADFSGAVSDTVSVAITVIPQNDPPTVAADSATVNEGAAVTIDVLSNDIDTDGSLNVASVTIDGAPTNGTAVPNPVDGTITYTHNGSETTSDSFTYTVADDLGAVSSPATVTITVTPQNDPPLAVNDTATVDEGASVTINVLNNDSDVDGNLVPATVTVVGGVANGTAAAQADGTIIYTHNGSETLTGSLTYTVEDNSGAVSQPASVDITVTPQNDPPTVTDDTASVSEGASVVISVLNNDTDVDGTLDLGSITIVDAPTNGTAGPNPDGTVTYTHNGTETTSDSFTYTVADNSGAVSQLASVAITVTPQNDPPTTAPDTATVNEGESVTINVLANDSDIDGTLNAATVTIVDMPTNGTATANTNGTVIYTHNGSETTSDSFTYTVEDNLGAVSSATTVSITVVPQNDPPVIDGQNTVSTPEETALTITLPDLVVSDPDNNYPADFTLTVQDGTNYARTGNTITPVVNFNGSLEVPVQVNDGNLNSNVFTLVVSVTAVNDAPVITGQNTLSTAEETALTITLANLIVSDPDNSYPADFTLAVQDGTNYARTGNTITPATDFNGDLTVPVIVNDGAADSNTFNLAVSVTPVNDIPVITGQNPLSTAEDTALTLALANLTVSDPDNSYPADFTLTVLDGTNYTHTGNTVTPKPDFNGDLMVSVKVNDGTSDSVAFNALVAVAAVNDAPVVAPLSNQVVDEGQTLTFDVSATDVDGDSLTLTMSSTDLPPAAQFVNHGDGTGTFTWVTNFTSAGTYSVTFTAFDGVLDDSTTIDIVVGSTNRPPVLDPIGPQTLAEGASVSIPLSANDPDTQDTLVFSLDNAGVPFASLVDNGDGTAVLNLAPDFTQSGDYFATVLVTDDGTPKLSDFEIINITVTDTNRAPVLSPIGTQTAAEGKTTQIDISALDLDGDAIVLSASGLPAFAVFMDNGNGTGQITLSPEVGTAGTYPVTVTATDDGTPVQTASENFDIVITTYSKLWVGGDASDPTGWSNPNNWSPASVPLSDDNVYIPVTDFTVELQEDVAINDLTVDDGTALDIKAFTLTASGHVSTGNSMSGTGVVEMTGMDALLQGTIPNLTVSGSVLLQGTTDVTGDILISGTGSLDINGQDLQVNGNMETAGSGLLIMQNVNGLDNVTVLGDASFGGGSTIGYLTAGTLSVSGNFTQGNGDASSFAPSDSHHVVMDGTATQHITFKAPQSSGSFFQDLEILNSVGVVADSNVLVKGTLTNHGLLVTATGSTVTVTGDQFTNDTDGVLQGHGGFNVANTTFINDGTINPGGSAGKLAITGDLPQSPNTTINIELGGTTAGQDYDQLNVSGAVTAGGNLNVSYIYNYTPVPGDSFTLLTATNGISGVFANENLPDIDPSMDWLLSYNANDVTLRVIFRNASTVVNSDDDTDDGTCDSTHCSLREAITVANVNPGRDFIAFQIPGDGAHTINLASPLPEITDAIIIDGWTQPGFAVQPVIALNGSGLDSDGLVISAGNTRIRGLAIYGFLGNGIAIKGQGANTITGNYLGTDTNGTAGLMTGGDGIFIDNVPNNIIGGSTSNVGNVIVNNTGNGIVISGANATGNIIQGNFIGTNSTQDSGFGNTVNGVLITNGASNNQTGGLDSGNGNVIAFNGGDGVSVVSGTGNSILSNRIDSNAGLGIDLQDDDVSLNDADDTDAGANDLQNFPVVSPIISSATSISGSLTSTPDSTFTIQLFSQDSCDASGYGEGSTYLTTETVTTDAVGQTTFNADPGVPLVEGQWITATATSADNSTSEFSACTQVTVAAFPDLSLDLSHSGNFVVGGTGSYTLTVTNTGGEPTVDTITITDTLPEGLTFLPGNNGADWACSAGGQTVTCNYDATLQPQETTAATITVSVNSSAVPQVTNVASVATSTDDNDTNNTDQDVTNVFFPDISSEFIITPDSIPDGQVDKPYSVRFTANNGIQPLTVQIDASVPGLEVSNNELSGIPTDANDQGYTVSVTITDSSTPAKVVSKDYTLIIKEAAAGLNITTSQLPEGVAGASYTAQLTAEGGAPPYRWSMSSGGLPPGLKLLSTGLITGVPTDVSSSTFNFKVYAADRQGNDSVSGDLSITVNGTNLANQTPALPNGLVDVEYETPILVSGGSNSYTCSLDSGSLPPGLLLEGCHITGVPSVAGIYAFDVAVQDSRNSSASTAISLSITIVAQTEIPKGQPPKFYNDDGSPRFTDVSEEIGMGTPGGDYPDEDLQSMTTDKFGNQYIVGYGYDDRAKSYVIHVLKFDAQGNIVWHQLYDSGAHNYGYGIALAPDQSIYVSGYVLAGNVFKGLVVKFDNGGVFKWAREYSSDYLTDTFYSLAADQTGVYAVGEHYNGQDFDALVVKYSDQGEQLWQKEFSTTLNDRAYAATLFDCADTGNKCLVVGGVSGGGEINGVDTGTSGRNGWLQIFDAGDSTPQTGGAVVGKSMSIGGTTVEDLLADNNGNLYVAGTRTNGDWRLMKFDADSLATSTPLWDKQDYWQGTDTNPRRIRSIALDQEGYIYAVGLRQNGNEDVLIGLFDNAGEKLSELIVDKGQNEQAHSVVVDANQRIVVSGQSSGAAGSTFLLLFLDTGKVYK